MFSFVRWPEEREREREENSSFYRMRSCKKVVSEKTFSTERKKRKRIIKGGIRRKSKTASGGTNSF